MTISMIGIDHDRAPVDIRALFAFTKKNAGEAMEKLKERAGIHGCIILSTCNRLEIWTSHEDGQQISMYQCLCQLKGIQDDSYERYFTARQDREAVEHLFYLAGGLKSQILGEDQILTQIKEALNLAREHFTTDSVLEVLFRMAVTAGKKIKTEAPLAHGNPSVIHQAVRYLKEQGYDMHGKTCMVIGNGEMGKVAAQTLRDAGANVTVTVRQYRSGMVSIPIGCSRIHYGERMRFLPNCDVVVSATASPNFTLREELFQNIILSRPLLLLDLAVPRDIEPSLGNRDGITLYDMDSFRTDRFSPEASESLKKAGFIVEEQMTEFFQWLDGRDVIPRIQEIREDAVQDLNLRIEKILKKTPMQDEDRENLLKAVDVAAGKVVSKMIFGLRDSLNQDAFLECVAGLEKVYEE
ncbi:glutamyl-tRNA reductase [Blautia sp. MSJ-19]|uniref:glutamyl-tRNA reductase n=1 Tax=Blautia sp. MSJ-19 TaxID=2841517 RepID=UPI001C0E9ACF|nr:glutamyl-tRNA reductase [Blautia sp. MSJ-19]MBU5482658.1 glutamyl-tRNA reductase [Blautia sp. MSJ-19]